LRNLDAAAHYSLLEKPLFKDHIIPRRAEELAHRLSKVLSSLFVDNEDIILNVTSSYGSFSTWGEDEEHWKSRREKLVGIFRNAITIKQVSMISTHKFAAVFQPPHTPFKEDKMKAETISGAPLQRTPPVARNLEVKICLLPSLHALKQGCTQVLYNNFIQQNPTEGEEWEQLTEAIVVVEP
jgi:hypothetical protein